MPMQIFGGVKEVYYGICASSELEKPQDKEQNYLQTFSLMLPGLMSL